MTIARKLPYPCDMGDLSFKQRMQKMAETKTRQLPNGQPSKHSKDSKLWALISLAREVRGDVDGIQNFSSLIENKKLLEVELNTRLREIKQLKQDLQQANQDWHTLKRLQPMRSPY
jgi:hypothetical protein